MKYLLCWITWIYDRDLLGSVWRWDTLTNEAHLKGELFPTEIRAVSAGIVNVTNHIPVVINMLTFPMITSAGLLHIAMYVYGAFAFLMAVWGIMTIKVWKTLESHTVRHQ